MARIVRKLEEMKKKIEELNFDHVQRYEMVAKRIW